MYAHVGNTIGLEQLHLLQHEGSIYTEHFLFKGFCHKLRSNDMLSEMKLVIEQCGGPLTTLATLSIAFVVSPRLVPIFQALLLIYKLFIH